MLKFLVAAAGVAVIATPAMAASRDTPRTMRVSYADLDLTGLAGQATLDRRIKRAVTAVCIDYEDVKDFNLVLLGRKCKARARALVAPQVSAAVAKAAAVAGTKARRGIEIGSTR